MKNEFMMTTEAARLLNRSSEAVRKYEREQKLPAIRVSGRRVFRRDDVERLATELKAKDKDRRT